MLEADAASSLHATLSAVAKLTSSTYTPAPLSFERLSEEEALRRSRDFLARVAERRSVRHFSDEAVPHELIENAIRAAGTAPSGANQQPWTFVVISDPDLRARLRAAAEHEEDLLYTQRARGKSFEQSEPIGPDEHKPHVTDAPYLIAVF